MMCCGYCTPVGVVVLIVGLALSATAYNIFIITRFPTVGWKVFLCAFFSLLILAAGGAVLWSFYKIIFTSPGYVPADPWRYPPQSSGAEASGIGGTRGTSTSVTNTDTLNRRFNGTSLRSSPEMTPVGASVTILSSSRPPAAAAAAGGVGGPAQSENGNQLHNRQYHPSAGRVGSPLQAAPPDAAAGAVAAGATWTPTSVHRVGGDGSDAHDALLQTPSSSSQAVQSGGAANHVEGTTVAVEMPATAKELRHGPASQTDSPRMNAATNAEVATGNVARAGTPPRNPFFVTQVDWRTHRLRYCRLCEQYVPDDAHHCRICGRCVYKLDHHCPFINNCVGRNNFKLFVVFLLYGGLGCLGGAVLSLISFFVLDEGDIFDRVGWIAIPAVLIILGLSLVLFAAQHISQYNQGMTTMDVAINQYRRSYNGDDCPECCKFGFGRHPQPTAEEVATAKRVKQAQIRHHKKVMFGNQQPWYYHLLPYPVREDDTADDVLDTCQDV